MRATQHRLGAGQHSKFTSLDRMLTAQHGVWLQQYEMRSEDKCLWTSRGGSALGLESTIPLLGYVGAFLVAGISMDFPVVRPTHPARI